MGLNDELEDGILSLSKYINQEKITRTTDSSYYEDETEIDPDYVHNLFKELESLRTDATKMVQQIRQEASTEFMYFVNQFEQAALDFVELIDAPGNFQSRKSTLDVSQIRGFLCRLQVTYIKIVAIYELYKTKKFPEVKYIREYLDRHRPVILNMINEDIEQFELQKNYQYFQQNQFVDEGLSYIYIIHLRIIKILMTYFIIYTYSDLPASVKKFNTDTIARILLHLIQLQEKMETATKTIHMGPVEVVHLLYLISVDLEKFLAFAENYITEEPAPALANPTDRLRRFFEGIAEKALPIKGIVELYTSRSCGVCKFFFETPLWIFLQKLTRELGLQIRSIDTYFRDQDALCYGVFGILQTPTLKYQDRLYYINPAPQERSDPHITVKRELLDFFGVLGIYDEEKGLGSKESTIQEKGELLK